MSLVLYVLGTKPNCWKNLKFPLMMLRDEITKANQTSVEGIDALRPLI